MSVNTELQNLLTKMGGSPLESDSNSDLIKKISEAYDGSGSGGESASSNSYHYYVPFTPEYSSNGGISLTAGKTYTDVLQAKNAGKIVMGLGPLLNGLFREIPLIGISSNIAQFSASLPSADGTLLIVDVFLGNDDTVTYNTSTLLLVPTPSSSDNGKVLTASESHARWDLVPNGGGISAA